MDKNRQRKLAARENRQASLHTRTADNTAIVQVPPPKDMISKSSVKVSKPELKTIAKKKPVVVATKQPLAKEKRGRGRPSKSNAKQNPVGKKKTTVGTTKGKR